MYKYILVFILILIIFSFDFIRDYIFQNMNLQIHYLNHINNDGPTIFNYTDSLMEKILSGISISGLIRIKWLLSFSFVFIYLILSCFLGSTIYNKTRKRFIIFSIALFVFVFIFSSLAYFISYYYSNEMQNTFYYISMELSHYLQSSLAPITLIVAFQAYDIISDS